MSAATMFAIVAPTGYTKPEGYAVATVPRPTVSAADDVLIRVHASSINPVDVKKAGGALKMILPDTFPYLIGYDAAGIVEAVGSAVTSFKAGDSVYVRLPETSRGAWADYAVCPAEYIAHIPAGLSFGDAASLPLVAMTALQSLRKYRGSLAGKTVFVPAGLGGVGAVACQLAKNVFGAGKVITTVSTSKVALVPQLLGEGVVDQIIDYTKEDPTAAIPRGSVDFALDTTGQAMQFLALMVPATSTIVSIATTPSGATLQSSGAMRRPGNPRVPLVARLFLDAADTVRRLRARRWGVEYMYVFLEPTGADLATLAQYAAVSDGAAAKLRAVVGARVDAHDIAAVQAACTQTYEGKGGIGKTVLEVVRA